MVPSEKTLLRWCQIMNESFFIVLLMHPIDNNFRKINSGLTKWEMAGASTVIRKSRKSTMRLFSEG